MSVEKEDSAWPLPVFYFKVEIVGLGEMAFKEVFGLDVETEIMEYRHRNSPQFSTNKLPGIRKYNKIQLMKGEFENNNKLFDWFNDFKLNIILRKPITITLVDEAENPSMVWKLKNAFPTKVIGVSLKSDGSKATIEQLDMVHEGIVIDYT